jgi:hypothetical protein
MRRYLILPPIEVRSDVNIHRVGPLTLFYGSKDDRTNTEGVEVGVSTFQIHEQDADIGPETKE